MFCGVCVCVFVCICGDVYVVMCMSSVCFIGVCEITYRCRLCFACSGGSLNDHSVVCTPPLLVLTVREDLQRCVELGWIQTTQPP